MRRLPRFRFGLSCFLTLIGAIAALCAWFNYKYLAPERRLHAALIAAQDGIGPYDHRNNLSWKDRIVEGLLITLLGHASTVTVSGYGFGAWDDDGLARFEKVPQLEQIEQIITCKIIATPEARDISDAGVYHLRRFKHLRWLRFRSGAGWTPERMRITDASVKYIASMRKLEALNLDNTMITDAGIDEIVKLSELRFLALNHTDISDAGIEKLTKLPNLEILEVFKTKITEAAVGSLMRMPKLRSIYHSFRFSSEAYRKLESAHPGLQYIQTEWDDNALDVLQAP